MSNGFWDNLKKPVIGLAPMDGVTDPAFRYITAITSKPSVIFTEFVNVEGLARGATKMLYGFFYSKKERPIVAQLFGTEIDSFYKAAVLICYLGFDGIDINMGCPVNKIAGKGSGAALIKNPKLAKKIIKSVQKGINDFANGISLERAGVHEDVIAFCKKNKMILKKPEKKIIPLSVKTRIGYNEISAEEWAKTLIGFGVKILTMHGRTFKQLYSGEANWEVLGKVAKICKKNDVFFLGNGDISSMAEAKEKIKKYGCDGVLVGRATNGNPWFFKGKDPSLKDRLNAIKKHVKYFEKLAYLPFQTLKKHLAWYTKGFEGAKEMRMEFMQAQSGKDIERIVEEFSKRIK
ncbi:tRNA-dihydrouridine synthase [Candidatus Gracilibacteria bacterium]|nr:tRNA-dihydrouridine synthase [Candidatus Gracilibacteria bacterium]